MREQNKWLTHKTILLDFNLKDKLLAVDQLDMY